jgi:hypothetical protein
MCTFWNRDKFNAKDNNRVLKGEGLVFQQECKDVFSFHQMSYAEDVSKPV